MNLYFCSFPTSTTRRTKNVPAARNDLNLLTFWCLLPRSSGCGAAPPTAGRPQCQRWKRRRSRGGGRFPALAGCPTEGSRESAYLVGRKETASAKIEIRVYIYIYKYIWMTRAVASSSCLRRLNWTSGYNTISRPLSIPRTRRNRFAPAADVITSGDETPGDSLTSSLPTGSEAPQTPPTASVVRAGAVSVCPLLSARRVYHRQSQRSGPWGRRLCALPPAASSHWQSLPFWQPHSAAVR